MNAFITYDVSGRQPEVKSEMIRLGYYDRWSANNQVYYLPNTCLWKLNIELNASLLEIQGVINKLNAMAMIQPKIVLLRCIVVSTNPWAGIVGVAKQTENLLDSLR